MKVDWTSRDHDKGPEGPCSLAPILIRLRVWQATNWGSFASDAPLQPARLVWPESIGLFHLSASVALHHFHLMPSASQTRNEYQSPTITLRVDPML